MTLEKAAAHTLIIFDNAGDAELYLLPQEVYKKHQRHLNGAAGKYVNCDEFDAHLEFVDAAFAEVKYRDRYCADYGGDPSDVCCLRQYAVDSTSSFEARIERVILCGFCP